MNPTIDTFWTAYLTSLPEGTPLPPKGYEAWGFGRTPELASRERASARTGGSQPHHRWQR